MMPRSAHKKSPRQSAGSQGGKDTAFDRERLDGGVSSRPCESTLAGSALNRPHDYRHPCLWPQKHGPNSQANCSCLEPSVARGAECVSSCVPLMGRRLWHFQKSVKRSLAKQKRSTIPIKTKVFVAQARFIRQENQLNFSSIADIARNSRVGLYASAILGHNSPVDRVSLRRAQQTPRASLLLSPGDLLAIPGAPEPMLVEQGNFKIEARDLPDGSAFEIPRLRNP